MASMDNTSSSVARRLKSGDLLHAGLAIALLLVVQTVGGLVVSTGKVSSIEAMNGSTVLLPCTYTSCIGIKNLYFSWQYNDNGTRLRILEGMIPEEEALPMPYVHHERVEFVGSSKSNNISILLWNITYEDEGEYICFARNPKEKGHSNSAIFTLSVVDHMTEVDDSLTVIIVPVLGGVIVLVIIAVVLKTLAVHFLMRHD